MSSKLQKTLHFFVCVLSMLLLLNSCVPVRKQLVLTDKSRHTLKEKQKVDTVVNVTPYEYKIRPGDVLSVEIVSITPGEYNMTTAAKTGGDVQSGYLVNDSGYVDVPIIGMVKVSEQNVEQVRTKIKTIASDYLNNVTVSVRLLNFVVTIMGELIGTVSSPDGRLSIIQAYSKIGGSNENVNLEKVKIIREIDGGKNIHVFYVDLSDVGIINKPEFFLMPKDILVLEPLRAKNRNNYRNIMTTVTASISAFILFFTIKNQLKF